MPLAVAFTSVLYFYIINYSFPKKIHKCLASLPVLVRSEGTQMRLFEPLLEIC